MIDNIRNAFVDMLDKSMWMDAESKKRAKDKVRSTRGDERFIGLSPLKAMAIDEKIGYPEYLGYANNTELERIYAEVGHR